MQKFFAILVRASQTSRILMNS